MATSGQLRIPHFQRSFVWDRQDVRKLLDSIYRGYPVGTILLWKRPADQGIIELGPIRVEVESRSEAYWVVDGQQRITALVGSLGAEFADIDERFEHELNFATGRIESSRKGTSPARAVPIRQSRDTKSMSHWLRLHDDELEPSDFDLGDGLVGAIRDYKLAAYVVEGDDEAVLRDIFDRTNSSGKPISRAQVFHALFATTGTPGSPLSVIRSLDRLTFGQLEENRIVQSLLAIRGGDVQRDLHEEFGNDDNPSDWYDQTEAALTMAIQFIRSEGVPHILLLPSTLPLPVLAAFFHLHKNPSDLAMRTLGKWLWRGWVFGYGREGQTPAMRRAVRQVNPRRLVPEAAPDAETAARALLDSIPIAELPKTRLKDFNTKNAAGRLILLTQASLRPSYSNGNQIELQNRLNELGVSAVTDFAVGHRSWAAARSFWPTDLYNLTGIESPRVLASHLISNFAAEAFIKGDIDGFITAREESMDALVSQFLTRRIDVDYVAYQSVSDLIIDDSI